MAAMATCTQAFAGLRLKASAKASPAKLSARTTLGAKPVARTVVMPRATRAHRLTVRAADDEAAPANDDAAPASASVDEGDAPAPRARGRGRGRGRGRRGRDDGDGLEESVVQVQRVTKVTKGGSNMSFRATVVVGDGKGKVGVGCSKAKEVQVAVTKAAADARKCMISVPLAKGQSFPHRVTVKGNGGAVVMLRPAGPGTGVIAGGSCRTVLELAGYKNVFAKQLGSSSPLNNARAVVKGLSQMRTYKQVAKERDMTVEELFSA